MFFFIANIAQQLSPPLGRGTSPQKPSVAAMAVLFTRKFLALCTVLVIPFHLFGDDLEQAPTIATVGMYLTQIDNINVKEQTFEAEFYLWLDWSGQHSPQNYEFVNGKDIKRPFDTLEVDAGEHFLSVKVRGTFRSKLDVSRYPRDKHTLTIQLQNFDWPGDELQYVIEPDPAYTGMSEDVGSPEWTIEYIGTKIASRYFPPVDKSFSSHEFSISIKRVLTPFLIKIFAPLLIVVAVSMLTFWIAAAEFEAQAGIGVTAVLSIIAFHFTIANDLPDVGYLTTADILMMGSYFFVFFALVESIWVNTLFRRKKETASSRIDKICRVLFPSAYVVFVLSLAVLR